MSSRRVTPAEWWALAKDLTAGVLFVVFTISVFWGLGELADLLQAAGWLD